MWWINLVRKVQCKWKRGWRLEKIYRELRLMIQLGGKKMRRAIRGAQAGLRRFARFQMWLIRKKEHLQLLRRRQGLVVPADLSSMGDEEEEGEEVNGEEVEDDELLRGYVVDDLDVISYEEAFSDHSCCSSFETGVGSSSGCSSCCSKKKNGGTLLEDGKKHSCSGSIYTNPPGAGSSSSSPHHHRHHHCNSSSQGAHLSPRRSKVSPGINIEGSGYGSSYSNHQRRMTKTKAGKSPRSHGRRSLFSDTDSYSEFIEEQTSQRSAFLDFLFEDSPSSPSRFLTAQALQNILGCPTCREIVSILPSDISNSSSGNRRDLRGCRPCEQCQGYSQTGKCLLCECSYGETKSLLLEKLTMSWWHRPCLYQSYGCQSHVGFGATDDDILHVEEECKFKPLHCPFMLCRRKFPAASLIKHLQSEHHLVPHDGPKSEGNIFCLGNNKRRVDGADRRANYTLDPCALTCYGNLFILRIFRHSTSWYIWVWAFRIDNKEAPAIASRPGDGEAATATTTTATTTTSGSAHTTDNFPYTIRFRTSSASRLSTSTDSSANTKADLVLTGFTVPLRLSMEEIMERGRCLVVPEQGSIFDRLEGNADNPLAVDFTLFIHPAKVSRAKMRAQSKRASSRPKSY